MVCQIGMGYGIWESLAHLAGNRLGGHEKVWVMGGYGLSQVWVKTEVTCTYIFPTAPTNSETRQMYRPERRTGFPVLASGEATNLAELPRCQ
jgi:hypothetical protein